MRGLITFILAMVLASAAVRADMADFKDADSGISIQHPEEWKPSDLVQPGMVARFVTPLDGESDKYQEEFTIKVLEMNQQADVNELVDAIKPGMAQTLPGYREISDEQITVAGRPGRRIVSEVTTQYSPIRATQWFVVDGTKLIIITLNATPATFEQFKPYGQAMIESLRIESR